MIIMAVEKKQKSFDEKLFTLLMKEYGLTKAIDSIAKIAQILK